MKFLRGLLVAAVMSLILVAQGLAAFSGTELIDMRTESAKFYNSQNGRIRGVFYTGPVHYRNTQGKWIDIDQNVVDTATIAKSDDNLKRFNISLDLPSKAPETELGVIEVLLLPYDVQQ